MMVYVPGSNVTSNVCTPALLEKVGVAPRVLPELLWTVRLWVNWPVLVTLKVIVPAETSLRLMSMAHSRSTASIVVLDGALISIVAVGSSCSSSGCWVGSSVGRVAAVLVGAEVGVCVGRVVGSWVGTSVDARGVVGVSVGISAVGVFVGAASVGSGVAVGSDILAVASSVDVGVASSVVGVEMGVSVAAIVEVGVGIERIGVGVGVSAPQAARLIAPSTPRTPVMVRCFAFWLMPVNISIPFYGPFLCMTFLLLTCLVYGSVIRREVCRYIEFRG